MTIFRVLARECREECLWWIQKFLGFESHYNLCAKAQNDVLAYFGLIKK